MCVCVYVCLLCVCVTIKMQCKEHEPALEVCVWVRSRYKEGS